MCTRRWLASHAAALPPPSNVTPLPAESLPGRHRGDGIERRFDGAEGIDHAGAALAASLVQAHSPLLGSVVGQVGTSTAPAGNGVALDLIRAINCGGVRLLFTERISAATPDTMGAEKLVPRLGLRLVRV